MPANAAFEPRAEEHDIDPAAKQIEGWLEHESRWWVMPYNFANATDAHGFMKQLQAHNPGRKFRFAAHVPA